MQWSEFLKILLEKFNIRQTFKKDAKTQKSRVYNIVEMAQNIYTWQYNRPGLTETESFTIPAPPKNPGAYFDRVLYEIQCKKHCMAYDKQGESIK